jgi:hypothetical protein
MNEYTLYTSADHKTFEVVERYQRDEDLWIKYRNQDTQQEYTCRLEAFLARFSPKAESR